MAIAGFVVFLVFGSGAGYMATVDKDFNGDFWKWSAMSLLGLAVFAICV
jgi:hypothetical protein